MMESMTGFAERSFSFSTLRAKISLKSLNHRYLDWSYKGPPLGRLENRMRAACQKSIRRGRVEVSLDLTFLDPAGWDLFVNQPLLVKILDALKKAAGQPRSEIRFAVDNIFRIPNVVELRHKGLRPGETEILARAFSSTLADLVGARRREGRAIERQLWSQVRSIRRSLGRIERRFRAQRGSMRGKLRQRLRELPGAVPPSEERLAQEAALLVQRSDITEEIVRLKSHLEAVRHSLSSRKKAGSAGRMLDFLSQEIFREANTINSKSQDLAITRECLILKGEVEAIRQQAQNLE